MSRDITPHGAERNGNDHGKSNGHWVYTGIFWDCIRG